MFLVMPFIAQLFLQAPNLAPVAACAGALLLIAVVWSYSSQLRSMRWPWRGLLPLLRGVAVIALALSLLKPVAVRVASAAQRGSLLLLVDRSKSMSVTDNSRSIAQLVALADALGKLPPGVRTDSSSVLSAAFEHLSTLASDVKAAQDDLDYARVSGHDVDLRLAHLRAAATRYADAIKVPALTTESIDPESDLYRRVNELSQVPPADARDAWKNDVPNRIARAQDALAQHQSLLDEQLYQSNEEVQGSCDELSRLSRFALVQQALLRPGGILSQLNAHADVSAFSLAESVQPLGLPAHDSMNNGAIATAPDGHQSDLTRGITQAIAGRNVGAVVLFSDGRQVGGDPTITSGLTQGAVPVFTVSAAAASPPHDLAIANVRAPSSVFAGQTFGVHIDVRHEGINRGDISVRLEAPGQQEKVATAQIREGRRFAAADFRVKLSEAGAQKLRIWFPKADGEATDANNHIERWVKVVPRRMQVLLIASSPTWDFQFVRSALSRSPEAEIRTTLLGEGQKWSLQADDISSADVIVLFDPPAAALDATRWDMLEQFVERRGGSIILVAGDHLPGEFGRTAPIPLTKLLPWRTLAFTPVWRVWPGESPEFHFVPSSEAASLEALRLSDFEASATTENSPSRWEELPGAFRFVQLPELGDHEAWNRSVHQLLVESESRLAVLTEMRVGAGRAFFMGINETWRWRTRPGEPDQDRFWRQLVSYASDQPYFARANPLALDVDRISVEPGETIHVRARLLDEKPTAAALQDLHVLRDGKLYASKPLDPANPPGSGRFTASLNLPQGEYELRWSRALARGNAVTVQIPLHVAASDEQEMADLSGDARFLRKIASATGGEFFTMDKVNALPQRVLSSDATRSRFAELPLWDSPYLFWFVLGCLGTEWALRKRIGLA